MGSCEGDGKCGTRCPLANTEFVRMCFPDGMPEKLSAAELGTLKVGGVNNCRTCLSQVLSADPDDDAPDEPEERDPELDTEVSSF